MVKDPVCKADVNEEDTAFKTTYKNKTYHFCSEECKSRFDNTVSNLKQAGGGICYGVRIEEEKALNE